MTARSTTLVCISTASVVILAGCAVPILTSTPSVSRFTLAEAEWGNAEERLVVACYRLKNGPHISPARAFRVLEVSSEGDYATPANPMWGAAGLATFGWIVPYMSLQVEPAHVVISTRGAFGVYEPHNGTNTLYRQSDVPLLMRVGPSLEVVKATTSRPASEVDFLMGILLAQILICHQPEGGPSVGQHKAIPQSDAARLARFVHDHGAHFSRMTRTLARRLTERYEHNFGGSAGAVLEEYSNGREPRFEKLVENCSAADRDYLTSVWKELESAPSRERWPGGSMLRWTNAAPGKCNVCGTLAADGRTYRWERGRSFGPSIWFDDSAYVRDVGDGLIELAICSPCLKQAAVDRGLAPKPHKRGSGEAEIR